MLDGQHQRVDIPANARIAHKGLLQKRLEEDLCWIICHVPVTTQSVKDWSKWRTSTTTQFKTNSSCVSIFSFMSSTCQTKPVLRRLVPLNFRLAAQRVLLTAVKRNSLKHTNETKTQRFLLCSRVLWCLHTLCTRQKADSFYAYRCGERILIIIFCLWSDFLLVGWGVGSSWFTSRHSVIYRGVRNS